VLPVECDRFRILSAQRQGSDFYAAIRCVIADGHVLDDAASTVSPRQLTAAKSI
jgi:hypothetical protein